MSPELFNLAARADEKAAQTAARRRAQAAAKRIMAAIAYEATLGDLLARLREAEGAAAKAPKRKRDAAVAVVAALKQQIERYETTEGPRLLAAAEAVAASIEGRAAVQPSAAARVPHAAAETDSPMPLPKARSRFG